MWIKTIVFILVGIAAVVLLLLGVGLIAVVLIWFWNHGRYKMGLMEKELEGDVRYSVHRAKKALKKIERSPLLKEAMNFYWVSVKKIIKRFFTKNNHEDNET